MRTLVLCVLVLLAAGCGQPGDCPSGEDCVAPSLSAGLLGSWTLASSQVVFDEPETVFSTILGGEPSLVPLVHPEDYELYGSGDGYLELELSVQLDFKEDQVLKMHRTLWFDGQFNHEMVAEGSWEVLDDDGEGFGRILMDFQPVDGYVYTWLSLLGSNWHHQEWDWEATDTGNDSCIYTADFVRTP